MRIKQRNEKHEFNNKDKGKVLFAASVYTHLAAFHLPFMKLLQEKGCDVYAAASSTDGCRDEVEAAGIKCFEIPFTRSPYSPVNLQVYQQLKILLKENHFDLVHVHTPVAAFIGRYLARKTNQGKVLYTAHGFHFYKGAPKRNWLIYYNAERIAAKWTDGLIVMNGEDYKNAKRLGFRPGENLFYVHGVGIDLDKYNVNTIDKSGIRDTLGIKPEDVVITCVAELNKNKNQVFLLNAWKELGKVCENAHLLLAGNGEEMDVLQQKVKQEHIQRAHFLGYRQDVPNILRETDIVTLVSKREGLPKCVMEAMAMNKPVVASNVRGNRDLVEDGKTGILVELGDARGLVEAFSKLISNSELRVAMGKAGHEKIQDYSLNKVLLEMADIYDRYLK